MKRPWEVWGMLCVHCAIRALMWRAAEEGELDPDWLSFTCSTRAEAFGNPLMTSRTGLTPIPFS